MAKNIDDLYDKLAEIAEEQGKTKVFLEEVVVKKSDCETHRSQLYKDINQCRKDQCKKIEKAGKLSRNST